MTDTNELELQIELGYNTLTLTNSLIFNPDAFPLLLESPLLKHKEISSEFRSSLPPYEQVIEYTFQADDASVYLHNHAAIETVLDELYPDQYYVTSLKD